MPIRDSWRKSLPARALNWFVRGSSMPQGPVAITISRHRLKTEPAGTLLTRVLPVRDPVLANGVPAEWFAPPMAETGRVLLYIHGGGYVMNTVDTHRECIYRMAGLLGGRGFAPRYRRAPEHPYPAALEDVLAAYRWLIDNGIAPGQIALAGDSAGGGLALGLLLTLRDQGEPLPAAAALFSPWTDLTLSGRTVERNRLYDAMVRPPMLRLARRLYLNGAPPNDGMASPLWADLHGLPPLFIQIGNTEVLLSDSIRLAGAVRAAGGTVELDVWGDQPHNFQLFAAVVPEAQRALVHATDFLKRYTAVSLAPLTAGQDGLESGKSRTGL